MACIRSARSGRTPGLCAGAAQLRLQQRDHPRAHAQPQRRFALPGSGRRQRVRVAAQPEVVSGAAHVLRADQRAGHARSRARHDPGAHRARGRTRRQHHRVPQLRGGLLRCTRRPYLPAVVEHIPGRGRHAAAQPHALRRPQLRVQAAVQRRAGECVSAGPARRRAAAGHPAGSGRRSGAGAADADRHRGEGQARRRHRLVLRHLRLRQRPPRQLAVDEDGAGRPDVGQRSRRPADRAVVDQSRRAGVRARAPGRRRPPQRTGRQSGLGVHELPHHRAGAGGGQHAAKRRLCADPSRRLVPQPVRHHRIRSAPEQRR